MNNVRSIVVVATVGLLARSVVRAAFNFGNNLPRLDSYIEATDRMAALAERENIDVMLSNHPGYDGTVAKMAALQRAPSAANPFVIGTPTVVRSLRVMGACARAQRDRFAMQS